MKWGNAQEQLKFGHHIDNVKSYLGIMMMQQMQQLLSKFMD